MKKKFIVLSLITMLMMAGCTSETTSIDTTTEVNTTTETVQVVETEKETSSQEETTVTVVSVEGSVLDTSEMFTERDLEQTADLTEAEYISLESNSDVTITGEGVYVLSGDVTDTMITVDADSEAKVQLVLDGVNVVNDDKPVIYVVSADKVFVTTTDSDNYMEVTGNYEADGDTNLDAVIFSKDDLVLNGTGTLEIVSNEGNGITSKDDLKVTGGTLVITAEQDGLEANDSVRIYDGNITIDSNKDAIHSENDDDDSMGYVYIAGGTINISAADDAIRGTSVVQIDGGNIVIETCVEGVEATYIQFNDGYISVYSTDDAFNSTSKSSAYEVVMELNGGEIDVVMASGDTDGFDSNGNIYVNGGTINFEGGSSFDANGTAVLNGGTVTVNGEVITEISSQQMGGKTKTRG